MDEYQNKVDKIQDNTVVSMSYVLRVDGGVVDQSDAQDPIQFLQGHGNIIPGLERQLYGMSVGESKQVVVSAAEGYGEADSEAFADVPRGEFPDDIPLETGVALQLHNEDDEILDAYIVEVRDDIVRLNFNHPLAGKELHFDVTVEDIREATEEEINHGHVHYDDMEEEDDEEWEDYDGEEEDDDFDDDDDDEDED